MWYPMNQGSRISLDSRKEGVQNLNDIRIPLYHSSLFFSMLASFILHAHCWHFLYLIGYNFAFFASQSRHSSCSLSPCHFGEKTSYIVGMVGPSIHFVLNCCRNRQLAQDKIIRMFSLAGLLNEDNLSLIDIRPAYHHEDYRRSFFRIRQEAKQTTL